MHNRATAVLELQGRLLTHAHAAQRPLDAVGHFAPTLCFEVECMGGHRRCRVEQHFQVGEEDQCQAAARQLKKGDVVSFHVSTDALVMQARGVTQLQKIEPVADMFPAAEAQPAQALQEAHA